jgi:hypothetical protein
MALIGKIEQDPRFFQAYLGEDKVEGQPYFNTFMASVSVLMAAEREGVSLEDAALELLLRFHQAENKHAANASRIHELLLGKKPDGLVD